MWNLQVKTFSPLLFLPSFLSISKDALYLIMWWHYFRGSKSVILPLLCLWFLFLAFNISISCCSTLHHRTGGKENFFHCNRCGKWRNYIYLTSFSVLRALFCSIILGIWFLFRMLLLKFDEGFTYLYRKSNAPQLPSLLWGKYSNVKAIYRYKSSYFFLFLWFNPAVCFWYHEKYYCFALWTHYASWMCDGDGKALSVSFCLPFCSFRNERNSILLARFGKNFLIPNNLIMQVFLPRLLEIILWHVPGMGKAWWGGRRCP